MDIDQPGDLAAGQEAQDEAHGNADGDHLCWARLAFWVPGLTLSR